MFTYINLTFPMAAQISFYAILELFIAKRSKGGDFINYLTT